MTAVFWDLDDTLLETLPARMRALEHAYRLCLGSSVDAIELWKSHRGGSLEALGQRLLGSEGPRFVHAYRDFYCSNPKDIRPFEGVREVLDALAEHGLPMAVVTAKISWGATEELEETGLLPYFAAVIGADDAEHHKPDPAPVYAAMDRLLITDASDVVFVGDSPADIFAARNAGALPVGATWGTIDEELLRDATPAHLLREPGDLLLLLGTIAMGGAAP